ncbi:MAG: metallophosphoesterase [Candidatus Aenigmatarchaeota archaeon]|nr:MAG: metallophosphoesterase [Candidatus Aenigmarchaeota archaeon]
MEGVRFVTNEAAMLVDDALVIGELHIGYETELYRNGVFLRSNTGAMLKRIQKLIRETKARKLFIIGDLKHNVTNITWQERREVPKFLEELSKSVEVHVVPGNHDGLIKELVPKGVRLHNQSGYKYKDAYLTHGHAWPSASVCSASMLIMAHLHPAVEFRDKLGFRSVEYCWLRGDANADALHKKYRKQRDKIKTKSVIVVPPFNNLTGGMPVNRPLAENLESRGSKLRNRGSEKEISPITRNHVVRVRECDVFLLDGTHLGKAGEIKAKA